MKKQLILEDGTVFIGEAFGSQTNCVGEVVFNTGMTGYQEITFRPILLWSNCDVNLSISWKLWNQSG